VNRDRRDQALRRAIAHDRSAGRHACDGGVPRASIAHDDRDDGADLHHTPSAGGALAAPAATPKRLGWRPKPTEYPPGKKEFDLRWLMGVVAAESKGRETHVYGGGGGGYVHNGSGHVAPTYVSSSTTVHDTLFVIDSEGKEHSLQLRDFDLAVRPDHEVTIVLMTKPGDTNGHFVAVRNHSTRQTYFKDANISRCLYPAASSSFWGFIATVSIFLTCLLSLIPIAIYRYVFVPAGIQEFKDKLSFVEA
jgi:hypothetical protein